MANPARNRNFSSTVTAASAAFVTAAFTVIACGSFAALIFSGPLNAFVPQGIWIGLLTALGVGLIVSLTSSFTGAIAIPQDRVAPILALMAASITTRMKNASPEEKCLSILAAIALVSLITGAFLFLLGRWRLGNLIRYIPYPVIGGFLAGSGWLLVRGALRVTTGQTLNFQSLPLFFRLDILMLWLPGVAFGGLLFFILRRLRHSLTVSQPAPVFSQPGNNLHRGPRDCRGAVEKNLLGRRNTGWSVFVLPRWARWGMRNENFKLEKGQQQ